jgi:hypothetical protein
VGWEGHVARIGDRKGAYRIWYGNLRERDNLEDLGIDGRVILKWVFKKWDGKGMLHVLETGGVHTGFGTET